MAACWRGCRGIPAGCVRAHRARRARSRPFHAGGLRHAAGTVFRCGRETGVGVPGGAGRSRVSRGVLGPRPALPVRRSHRRTSCTRSSSPAGSPGTSRASSAIPRSPRNRRSPRCWRARESPGRRAARRRFAGGRCGGPDGGLRFVGRDSGLGLPSTTALWRGHVGGCGDGAAARDGIGVTPEGGR